MPLTALSFLALALPGFVREPAPFPLVAASAVAMDAESGEILYARDPDTPRFPASTTKIVTTLLLLERTKPGQIIVAPADVKKVAESSMNLKPGERISSRDLAWALMLRSANDGCYAAAVALAGSVPAFARMMNDRARAAGALNTNFNNPNGLNDPRHVTTARDLALIAREALKNPEFAEMARTRRHKITRQKGQKDLLMVSKNKLLDQDPTADGVKTGWTIPSGHTYVGSATRLDATGRPRRVITAILNSPSWAEDHKNLLGYAFREFVAKPVAKAGERVGDLRVEGGGSVPVATREDVSAVGRPSDPPARLELPSATVAAPIEKGALVAEATVVCADGFRRKVPLVALAAAERAPFAAALGRSGRPSPGTVVAGGLIAAGTWALLRSRPRPQPTRRGGR